MSLEKQEVRVTGDVPYDDVLAKIKKTGKEVGLLVGLLVSCAHLDLGDVWPSRRLDIYVQIRTFECYMMLHPTEMSLHGSNYDMDHRLLYRTFPQHSQ